MLPTITLLFIPSLVVITIAAYFNYANIKKKNKARHQKGLARLKDLRFLLMSIQQHRGLTMGYINGDKALLNRIAPLKQNINTQIRNIQNQQHWDNENLIWVGVIDHWGRLSNNYENHDSKYNFTQHCNLILNMLNLIEDLAENHHLQELICSNNQNANFLWVQLLNTVEHIGQARAVGTSVAAAKKSTSVQRIKLNYLQNCINDFVKDKEHKIDTQMIESFLLAINKKILIDVPSISASDYFNLATEVSDIIFTKFDEYIDELSNQY